MYSAALMHQILGDFIVKLKMKVPEHYGFSRRRRCKEWARTLYSKLMALRSCVGLCEMKHLSSDFHTIAMAELQDKMVGLCRTLPT